MSATMSATDAQLCHRLSSCFVTNSISLEKQKRICHRPITDFVASNLTCQDGMKVQNFPMTSLFYGLSPFVSTTLMIHVCNFL